ncbi:Retrovirus-related Pol polyprotein, partial [Mucuna pruriens]
MAMPIFDTLKKGENFAWTPECEEAFLRLKALLAAPLVLTCPTLGIPLLIYIFVCNDALNAAMVQEKEGKQYPIYFTSKVLQGAERRYQKIKKEAFALVITSRKLRPYFQGYNTIVQTDLPILQVLQKPDLAGRMVAWRVQLFEFDISFEKRGYIKAQLASEDREWFLSVDGASNQAESGAGVILEGPDGVLIEQSLRFEFKANNNQAEYEALLAGMRLGQELEAKILTAKSDSKLYLEEGTTKVRHPQKLKQTDGGQVGSMLRWEKGDVDESVLRILERGSAPSDATKAKKLVREASKCVDEEESKYIIREVHEGACRTHIGGCALAGKITKAGYY